MPRPTESAPSHAASRLGIIRNAALWRLCRARHKRHSFGSERAGQIDALVLRDLMGHKSLRTTQRYAQVNPEAAKKAFQEFDRHRG